MKVELFPFQKVALADLRAKVAEALGGYKRTKTPQIVSYTAPTGAGKTIIMSSLIEDVFYGDENYPDQLNAIFVWLSDSPELNQQSKDKIDTKADKINLAQCEVISDESFDQEMLDDGKIYFLNTQKLSKTGNLTKHGDNRTYTIWETLSNTAREKADRLYFIIDEAHRGMQGRDAARATSIMQKFLKGSPEDGMPAMPVVIGMTATPERFNNLAAGISSTTQHVVTKTEEVRSSGLLKDRIIIAYPDTIDNDMAILQAATDDWKEKWEHWSQYCFEQHYAYVNPIFVIQVQSGNSECTSDTDLDDCLRKIEERMSEHFQFGEVVHTFGQTSASITINGLEVPYCEPSRIADDKKIKVVFFKENLSTGWDCPRAETMMSFRHAQDSTYIAQLLGRMIRTPMQMRIQVDDVLNDVHLFLPYFKADTVEEIAKELQNSEGSEIPTEICPESIENKGFDTLTVKPTIVRPVTPVSQHEQHNHHIDTDAGTDIGLYPTADGTEGGVNETTRGEVEYNTQPQENTQKSQSKDHPEPVSLARQQPAVPVGESAMAAKFDREEVMKAINESGLLTYEVRSVQISNYLKSLFALAHLFSQSRICPDASNDVVQDIVGMIHDHITTLKESGKYDELAQKVMQFKLNTQVFDVFGESIDDATTHDLFSTTDADLDRQFRQAEIKLCNEGVGVRYGSQYEDDEHPNDYKIDVIIYAADDECIAGLNAYAKERYHQLNDDNRRKTTTLTPQFKKKYDDIVSDGDIVSKHNLTLSETIRLRHSPDGKAYSDHLFVDDTGKAVIKLNSWEEGVLEEEQKQEDFVCWLRNIPRASWSLCIPYQQGTITLPTYPDFIVVRKDSDGKYVIDILEPHDPTRTDNIGKAKGFAKYAKENPGVGRIQLIRMGKDVAGNNRFKRLDMAKSLVRDKVLHATTNDELDHLFDTDGFFM